MIEFAIAGQGSRSSVTPEQVKALVENIETLDAIAFQTNDALQREMIFLIITGKKPLGVSLISPCTSCLLYGSKMQLRKDTYAPVVIYDIKHGTIPGAHFVQKGLAHLSNTMATTVVSITSCLTLIGIHLSTFISPEILDFLWRYCDRWMQTQ